MRSCFGARAIENEAKIKIMPTTTMSSFVASNTLCLDTKPSISKKNVSLSFALHTL